MPTYYVVLAAANELYRIEANEERTIIIIQNLQISEQFITVTDSQNEDGMGFYINIGDSIEISALNGYNAESAWYIYNYPYLADNIVIIHEGFSGRAPTTRVVSSPLQEPRARGGVM